MALKKDTTIEIERLTTEQAVILSLDTDPSLVWKIIHSDPDNQITITMNDTFQISAKEAKEIAKVWLSKNFEEDA